MSGVQTFELGDWDLQSGQTIPKAEIALKTFGGSKSPAIIYPSWYSGCKLWLYSITTLTDRAQLSLTMNG